MNNSNREVYAIYITVIYIIISVAQRVDWIGAASLRVMFTMRGQFAIAHSRSPRLVKRYFFNLSSQLIDFYNHIGKNIAN